MAAAAIGAACAAATASVPRARQPQCSSSPHHVLEASQGLVQALRRDPPEERCASRTACTASKLFAPDRSPQQRSPAGRFSSQYESAARWRLRESAHKRRLRRFASLDVHGTDCVNGAWERCRHRTANSRRPPAKTPTKTARRQRRRQREDSGEDSEDSGEDTDEDTDEDTKTPAKTGEDSAKTRKTARRQRRQ